jgi:hypothetical protein
MGDKSPKDKNKKNAQKTAATNQVKDDRKKHQASLDHTTVKAK